MPTYTYRCTECGNQFDKRQKFSDDPLTDCPRCDGRIRRLVNNSAAVVFKGSGFYVTDNKNGKRNGVPSSAESNGSANGSSEKSSEPASKEKSETKKATPE